MNSYRNSAIMAGALLILLFSVKHSNMVEGKTVEKESALYNVLDLHKQLGVIEYKGFPDEVK